MNHDIIFIFYFIINHAKKGERVRVRGRERGGPRTRASAKRWERRGERQMQRPRSFCVCVLIVETRASRQTMARLSLFPVNSFHSTSLNLQSLAFFLSTGENDHLDREEGGAACLQHCSALLHDSKSSTARTHAPLVDAKEL